MARAKTRTRRRVLVKAERHTKEQEPSTDQADLLFVKAGEVAHDLNCRLTSILLIADLLRLNQPDNSELQVNLAEITTSAKAAAKINADLIKFSRHHAWGKAEDNNWYEPSSITAVIQQLHATLERLIGNNIQLKMRLEPNAWPVKLKPTGLESLIINVVTNAVNAIPESRQGVIIIKTKNRFVECPRRSGKQHIPAGSYVLLKITDNGIGIDPDKLKQIFKPFVTGRKNGNGLGLSSVASFVEQSNGYRFVSSKFGQGTTFTFLFPAQVKDIMNEEQNLMDKQRQIG
jgi:two-component system cell cycle sensor histidine kinase/response regulator CckA